MKVPLSWLKEYIDLPFPPIQIAKMLTLAGLEVDSVETVAPSFKKVIVGKVTEVQKHPNADKLCIAMVTDGVETHQVVCGAPNCRTGLKTAFAVVGATLYDEEGKEMKVKRSKIRGVDSAGMLCSAKELRLGDEHNGIIEFAEHIQEGTDVAEIYSDTVFEISLTPNLTHCGCVVGIVRELAAATGAQVRYPTIKVEEDAALNIPDLTKVTILDTVRCPRYACRVVKNVAIGPSPEWLQNRLTASGIRPINNVVDITNYVFLELGHPLHAFDYDKLEGRQIVVRDAQAGESILTLDNKERVLTGDDLLISDLSSGVAIAGVMGGLHSVVTNETRDILLESAYFLPTAIRKTSKRLGLMTDASHRFERGADPNGVLQALDRTAMLIQKIAGGQVATGVIEVKDREFHEKIVSFRLSRANKLLGTHFGISEIESFLQRLSLPYQYDGRDHFKVTVPTYRGDINAEVDLIEEIVRIYGYDNISKPKSYYHSSDLPDSSIFTFEREVRLRLISEGLQEFVTCDLIGPTSLDVLLGKNAPLEQGSIKVLNPVSVEQSILRTSLLPGLLQLVKYNYDHQNQDISGFEIGRVHFKKGDQYRELSLVAIVLTGKNRPHSWKNKPHENDFYDLKGIVENLLDEIGIEVYSFKNNQLGNLHTGRQASIYVGSSEIGSLGEVHPAIMRRLDVPQRILFAEIDLHELIRSRKGTPVMQPLPIYPSSERDWTIKLKDTLTIDKALTAIRSIPSELLEEVALLDVYRNEKLGPEFQNVTFHFVYRDKQKTVSQEGVDAEHVRITTESLNLIHELQRG